MKQNKSHQEASIRKTTIPVGLEHLARAYKERDVAICRITLKRGHETYIHKVLENLRSSTFIEAHHKSVTLTVAFLPPIPTATHEILLSRTKYAAIDATDWEALPAQLELIDQDKTHSQSLLGTSKQVQNLIVDIQRAAHSKHIVLILGESGTGKTTAASVIHEQSCRADKPFIHLNCGVVPDTLMESELFGYEKGAFTGAVARKQGLFEAASGGTLFFDEIAELKLELQAKLLTAIEQRRIRRVGGLNEIKCDVRIMAASSSDLQQMVAEGKFREDLYYRLAVLEIVVPPLREHREDIPLLIRNRLVEEYQAGHTPNLLHVDEEALQELMCYDWPGNVRQLHNIVARLTAHADNTDRINRSDVQEQLVRFKARRMNGLTSSTDGAILLPADCRKLLPGESLRQFTVRIKTELIKSVRIHTGGMAAASLRLRTDRTALSKLQTRLNLTKQSLQ